MPNQSFIEERIKSFHNEFDNLFVESQMLNVDYVADYLRKSLELQKEKIIEEIEKLITENNLQGFNQCGYDYDLAIARSLEIVKSL